MTRGILSLHSSKKHVSNVTYILTKWQQIPKSKSYITQFENAGKRNFSTGKKLNKETKEAAEVKGTPYKKLTIGIPKETWKNERR